jgi:hypothetical protein
MWLSRRDLLQLVERGLDADLRYACVYGVSGNPNRFQSGPVRLRPDDEWISRMRPRDKTLVTLLTLPLLARYGYRISAGNAPVG